MKFSIKHGGYKYLIEVIVDVRFIDLQHLIERSVTLAKLDTMLDYTNERKTDKLEYCTSNVTLEADVNCESNNGR
ncbi:hypothetical protein T4D_16730 [Trichinella pseudospiralis]|uniref:Uncharacterized protein n=1 Tax=Trichinella pseudospiralis TaxID=6337 RepID=A0A0V1F6R7_TRIPS|nr:hypothetical protein T4D_16730 [Trichinella pseudospiralis]